MSVFVQTPQFPNVPFATGVPLVQRAPAFTQALQAVSLGVSLLTSDRYSNASMFDGPQWGIFDRDGNPVVQPDTILGMEYREEYQVADYPLERGGFSSYNKVAVPFDVRIRMAVSGSQGERADLLTTMQQIAGSLDLFTVATPDISYQSATVNHYDYRRETRNGGVSMVVVDVWLQEIRETGTTQFASTKQASSQLPQQGGNKQSTATPPGFTSGGTYGPFDPTTKPTPAPTPPSNVEIKIPSNTYGSYGSNYRTPQEIYGGAPTDSFRTPQQIYGGAPNTPGSNLTIQQMYGGTKGIQ